MKPGDKVRVLPGMGGLAAGYPFDDGEVLTVGQTHGTNVRIADRMGEWWHSTRFELVEDAEPLAEWERELLAATAGRVPLTLDPSNPFERALIEMVEVNRRKAHDYTRAESSIFDNFDRVEAMTGLPFNSATDTLIATKCARLSALSTREGGPVNESVDDTRLDLAVYGVIQYARHRFPTGVVEQEGTEA